MGQSDHQKPLPKEQDSLANYYRELYFQQRIRAAKLQRRLDRLTTKKTVQ